MRRNVQRERRTVPTFNGSVQVPFSDFDASQVEYLDPLDEEGTVIEVATGKRPPWERPRDPLTAWVTLAYVGGIEQGGPIFKAELDREQRLEVARTILSEEEVLVVETIAVPKRYRQMPARELEAMIRTAPDYLDRMWAACWLTLIGWVRSDQCSFDLGKSGLDDELENSIVEGYAATQGVTSQDDFLGQARMDKSYEVNLVLHRLNICEIHYDLNGPPPYEYMKDTVPFGPGWKQVVRIVPDAPRM